MTKNFTMHIRLRDMGDNRNRKHGRGCPRLHWLVLLLLGAASSVVWGQEVRPGLQSEPDRERRALQEQWFLRGRGSLAGTGALQRYHAHMQKMQMRSDRLRRAQQSGTGSPPPSSVVWSPLGPAPLASDASGTGEYNYGWVSGRATGIAIDPADATGNTVYIGGAYGGVWKSTNAGPASPSPASVTWQPLTDNQATLAVGAIAIQPGNNTNDSVILA